MKIQIKDFTGKVHNYDGVNRLKVYDREFNIELRFYDDNHHFHMIEVDKHENVKITLE